jgi:hypothetical protein
MPRADIFFAGAEGLELGKLARCAWGVREEQQRSNQVYRKKLREHVQGQHPEANVSASRCVHFWPEGTESHAAG